MTRPSFRSRVAIAIVLGLCGSLPRVAAAADLRAPQPLSDAQLDRISAGVIAFAQGDASATGNSLSDSHVNISAMAGVGGKIDGMASGQVSANATSATGSAAQASSTLSLGVFIP